MSLEGKVAIVTGASTGIGRAIAAAFGGAGAGVVVNYAHSRREAEETAELVRAAGGQPLLVQADVTSDEQVRAMVAKAGEHFGGVDVLVNNAGLTAHVPLADLERLTDEIWDRLYAINVKGAFLCARAVAEPMRKRGNGRIINIASIGGLRPAASSIPYGVTKAAMIHLNNLLATTLAPEIRVNAIAPGYIEDTNFRDGVPNLETVRETFAKSVPLRRVGTAAEVAEVALFLATAADYMTGAVLVLDGGKTLT